MSETAEAPKPTTLRRALMWVGIVAGVAVVAAAVFISGATVGWLPGWHDQPRHEAGCMMGKGNAPNGPMTGDKDCCKKRPGQPDCCEPQKP